MSDREATSKLSSSVREGVGYDEVNPSRREPEEDFPQSPKGNRLPIPLMMKIRMMRKMTREMSMRREMRKMTREMSMRRERRKIRVPSLKEERR